VGSAAGYGTASAQSVVQRLSSRNLPSRGRSFVDAQLAAPPQSWEPELLRAVASVTTADFAVLAADVHEVDEALDLLVLARRPAGPP
jgi:hypothetical protein